MAANLFICSFKLTAGTQLKRPKRYNRIAIEISMLLEFESRDIIQVLDKASHDLKELFRPSDCYKAITKPEKFLLSCEASFNNCFIIKNVVI